MTPPPKTAADFDLIIEGYPRSANTFVVTAVEMTNPDLRIAHHHHDSRWLAAGRKAGVPTLALIREPLDAVASFLVYSGADRGMAHSGGKPADKLARWIEFYGEHFEAADVIATFHQATRCLPFVIGRLNLLTGSHFARPADARKALAEVRSDRAGRAGIGPTTMPAPTPERAARLARAREIVRRLPDYEMAAELYGLIYRSTLD